MIGCFSYICLQSAPLTLTFNSLLGIYNTPVLYINRLFQYKPLSMSFHLPTNFAWFMRI